MLKCLYRQVVDICHKPLYYIIDICQKGAAMPRPQRCRCIDTYPDHWSFAPQDMEGKETIIMSLDEYEAIRLLDQEGLKQEECAEKMGVARTTVTAIYESARKKLADFLVLGKMLRIEGGRSEVVLSVLSLWQEPHLPGFPEPFRIYFLYPPDHLEEPCAP